LKLGSAQTESNILKANSKFFAIPWPVTGSVAVHTLNHKGAIAAEVPLLIHDDNTVNDFSFSPFNDHLLVTACQDGTAGIWKIPEGGLTETIVGSTSTINVTDKRLMTVDFHNLAENVLLTIDASKKMKLFDLETQQESLEFPDVHKQLITNASWSSDGKLVATSCKDKFVRVFDPRANKCIGEAADHQGAKGGRVLWLGYKDLVFTCGFGKGSERQYSVFDPRKFDQKLILETIDNSSSSLLPFYEPDNNVLFLAGKGDGNIRYYEVVDEHPYIFYLNEYKSKDPQSGVALLPKTSCDVMKCEILRLLKITPSGVIVPIKFEVPRAESQFFQEDLFPDTWDLKSTMSASEWFGGANNAPNKMSLNPEKK